MREPTKVSQQIKKIRKVEQVLMSQLYTKLNNSNELRDSNKLSQHNGEI